MSHILRDSHSDNKKSPEIWGVPHFVILLVCMPFWCPSFQSWMTHILGFRGDRSENETVHGKTKLRMRESDENTPLCVRVWIQLSFTQSCNKTCLCIWKIKSNNKHFGNGVFASFKLKSITCWYMGKYKEFKTNSVAHEMVNACPEWLSVSHILRLTKHKI